MTIYVRTQDKARLLEVNCVTYEAKRKVKKNVTSDTVFEEIIEERHKLTCCGTTLGEYATKERCLGIMQEIEDKINSEKSYNAVTYNMPEV